MVFTLDEVVGNSDSDSSVPDCFISGLNSRCIVWYGDGRCEICDRRDKRRIETDVVRSYRDDYETHQQ